MLHGSGADQLLPRHRHNSRPWVTPHAPTGAGFVPVMNTSTSPEQLAGGIARAMQRTHSSGSLDLAEGALSRTRAVRVLAQVCEFVATRQAHRTVMASEQRTAGRSR